MWSQSTFMIVYGKWVRTMYCEIPFMSRVLRIGEIIIQANSPIFGLSLWRCYNLLKYSIVPLDMCYILQQTLVVLTSWLHVALGNRHLKTNLELGTSSENKTSFAKPQFRGLLTFALFFLQGWIPTSFTVSIHCQYSHQPPVFWNVKSLCQTLYTRTSDFEDGSRTFSPCGKKKNASSLASSLPWYECLFCGKWVPNLQCRRFPLPSFH